MPKVTPNKLRLTTKAAVDAIPHSDKGQVVYWDTELTGFGVLAGARTKTFILDRRVKGTSNRRRVTIGRVGKITLQKAREDAQQLIGEITGGTDPVARKRDQTAGGITLRRAWELHQQAMKSKNGSTVTKDDYQNKIDVHMSDWLDQPLVEITRAACRARHTKVGENSGKYMANGCMRVLRAIWNRARRQFPDMPESPTKNVDFYPEHGRDTVITDWVAWWSGVQKIESPVRRDFYIFLAFTGCRSTETKIIELKDIDLEKGLVFFPITKTKSFEMPLSKFLIDILRKRVKQNGEMFGADCRWLFPSAASESGHLEEGKLVNEGEKELFPQLWSPHVLRHSWITNADQKVGISDSHQRALTNHKPKRAKSGDSHEGYIHVDIDDLRVSQQKMTDYILSKINPTPTKGKKRSGNNRNNVVDFKKRQVA